MTDKFERRISAEPAYDRRDDPEGNFGIHGVEFRFSLVGDVAAVSFGLSTGWLLPETVGVETADSDFLMNRIAYVRALHAHDASGLHPLPMAMTFHTAVPVSEWQRERGDVDCDLLPGGKCFGDVTFTGADRPFFALVHGGTDGMWDCLASELTSYLESSEPDPDEQIVVPGKDA